MERTSLTELPPESLLGRADAGLVVLDSSGKIALCNSAACRLIHDPVDRLLGSSFDSVLPLEVASEFKAWLEEGCASGRITLEWSDRALDIEATSSRHGEAVRLLTVHDASRRIAAHHGLERLSDEVARRRHESARYAEALALLRFFSEFVGNYPGVETALLLACQLGDNLFPLGGALYRSHQGELTLCGSWKGGAALPTSLPPAPQHRGEAIFGALNAGTPHADLSLAFGALVVLTPGDPTEPLGAALMASFGKALELALC